MKLKTLYSTTFLFLAVTLAACSSLSAQLVQVVTQNGNPKTGIGNAYATGDALASTLSGSRTNNSGQTRYMHVKFQLIVSSPTEGVTTWGPVQSSPILAGRKYVVGTPNPTNSATAVDPIADNYHYNFVTTSYWSTTADPEGSPKVDVVSDSVQFGNLPAGGGGGM